MQTFLCVSNTPKILDCKKLTEQCWVGDSACWDSSSDSDSSKKKKTLKSGPKVDRAKGLLDSSSDEEASEAKNSKGGAKVDKKKKSVQKSMLESSSESDGDSAKKPNEELETEDGHHSLVLEESSQSEKEESASKKKTAVLSDRSDHWHSSRFFAF